MAIIKNGKIHGKVGNYIYRVLNGVEIIQSYPRKIKVSEKTKAANARFSLCSVLSSKVYRVVKDVALNLVDHRLYRKLTSIFSIHLFSSSSIIGAEEYKDWKLIPSTDNIRIDTKEGEYNESLPSFSIINDACRLSIKDFIIPPHALRCFPNADYMELVFSLVHYDFDSELAQPVYEYRWDREVIGSAVSARKLEVDLADLETTAKDGLLLPCFGIRFFAYRESSGYLNSGVSNPFSVLGIWYKDRG